MTQNVAQNRSLTVFCVKFGQALQQLNRQGHFKSHLKKLN